MNDLQPSSVIGDVTPFPDFNEFDVKQNGMDTCAIKSQQIIMHSFGIDIPESTLVLEASAKGYFLPGQGTTPDMVGLLLEDHGIDVHTKQHATVYDLAAELAQGHKVIVGVDADELWYGSVWNDLFKGEQANHALIVTGIDTSNPNDVKVILTDPGTGEVARSYPMSQFMDAWHDSSCFMVATDEAPQVSYSGILTNPEMINFDYDSGHIPSIGNIPYDIYINDVVPHMNGFFDQQLPELHTSLDYQHIFDQMDHAYDTFDTMMLNHDFVSNDLHDFDDYDFDGLFDTLFF